MNLKPTRLVFSATAFIVLFAISGGKSAQAQKAVGIVLPADQQAVLNIVTTAQFEGAKVENDMQLGGVKAKRGTALCSTLTSFAVQNWVGKIQTIDSNSDGKGVFAVSIAPDVVVKTWNNALSDISTKTLIEPGSALFTVASGMKRGDLVSFSGTFFKGSESDCISEGSLRLKGKVLEPEFIFRFSSIAPYAPPQAAAVAPTPIQATMPAQAELVAAIPGPLAAAPTREVGPTVPTERPVAPPLPPQAKAATPAEPGPATVITAVPVKPSFDCAKASTLIEELICKDPELSALDAQLAVVYRAARARSTDEAGLRAAQLAWLKKERNTCSNGRCLSTAYASRIVVLSK